MIAVPRWTEDQLKIGLDKAKALFREARMQEPL